MRIYTRTHRRESTYRPSFLLTSTSLTIIFTGIIDEWLDKHRRGENAPNAKYTYTITKSDGTVIRTNSLKSTCKELNLNMFTLRKLSEIGLGLRKSFIPRQKEYRGWTVVRCQRNRKVS